MINERGELVTRFKIGDRFGLLVGKRYFVIYRIRLHEGNMVVYDIDYREPRSLYGKGVSTVTEDWLIGHVQRLREQKRNTRIPRSQR